jgi:hypothetical protein
VEFEAVKRLHSGVLCLFASTALVAGLLILAPAAQSRRAVNPTLVVTFTANGTVSVALPNGTAVGATSGTPTVIPSGYYTLVLNGPGECINLPLFELKGPGVDIQDDMLGGETDTHNLYANFLPNATYAWHIDRNQSVVYTFTASTSSAGGTLPTTSGSSSTSSGKTPVPTSQDITGSAILPFRGTLTGGVSAAGTLTLAYKGKSVTSLKAGKYTIAVSDKSSSSGFMLKKLNHATTSVTGVAFVGKHSASVQLTAGRWLFSPRIGKTAYSLAVIS